MEVGELRLESRSGGGGGRLRFPHVGGSERSCSLLSLMSVAMRTIM